MAARKRVVWRTGNHGLVYLRVSDQGQVTTEFDPEGMSLPAQRRKCVERAKDTKRVLVDELIDAGISATSIDQRESYKALLERVRTDPSVAFVMVYSLSRLHRNWPEAGLMVRQLQEFGVRIVSATEHMDFSTPEGMMMLGVMFSVHGYQSAANGIDLQYKMTQKALVGGTPGWVPIGYLNVRELFEGRSINTIAVDPVRAPYITRAFELFATGIYTYDDMVEELTLAGLRSRPNRKFPTERPISRGAVEDMLRNRYYLGYVKFSGKEYKGRHEPLVTQQLFDQVQEALRTMAGNGSRHRRYHHYLKGMIWCDRCGRRLIISRGKSATGALYFYYVCRGRQDKVCDLPYVRAVGVEAAVEQHYTSVCLGPELRGKLVELFDRSLDEHPGEAAARVAQLRSRLAELDRQEDRYIELALDPQWPTGKLTEKLQQIRDERSRIESKLTSNEQQLKQGRTSARRVLDYLDRPAELYKASSITQREKLNRLVFSRFRVDVLASGVQVVGDELTEPFASFVYLRRERNVREQNETGGTSDEAPPEVVAMIKSLLLAQPVGSSSSSDLAEDTRFELVRGCPQHAFQACAIGQLGESSVVDASGTHPGLD